jgi:hypothetical protein
MALVAIMGTSLGACSTVFDKGTERLPVDETGVWTFKDPTERELLLARSDFSVEMVRFTDARRPRSMELASNDQMIYQYDPDTLLGGVSYNVPAILSKYLTYRAKMPKHYKVEVDVKKLTTVIKTGTLLSGSWGRYSVEIELDVIARRPDSTVAFSRNLKFSREQRREDYNGRGPTRERDRARMHDLAESLLRKAAEEIGWNIRQRDARKWEVEAPQSIPTRLNLPPVDRASGEENVDEYIDLTPLLNNAVPVIIPSSSSDAWIDGELPEQIDEITPVMPTTIDNGLVI